MRQAVTSSTSLPARRSMRLICRNIRFVASFQKMYANILCLKNTQELLCQSNSKGDVIASGVQPILSCRVTWLHYLKRCWSLKVSIVSRVRCEEIMATNINHNKVVTIQKPTTIGT